MLEGIIFVLEYVKNYMLIPGQVENWVSIVDFSKLAMASFPRKAMKPCMSVLQSNYRA